MESTKEAKKLNLEEMNEVSGMNLLHSEVLEYIKTGRKTWE